MVFFLNAEEKVYARYGGRDATLLQWIAYELAQARGVNPDLIRREQEAYREAARFRG